ncbi:MAG: hypothetical protein ACREK3_05870, partial [Gemmatimonadota bacterium]
RDPGATANGPARSLLAADGLIAAAHETLAALGEERLLTALDALEGTFGDGGPWRGLSGRTLGDAASTDHDPPAWPAFVALALAPAASDRPDGPWADLASAWKERYAARQDDDAAEPANRDLHDNEGLYRHSALDESTGALLQAAAAAARRPGRNGTLAGT